MSEKKQNVRTPYEAVSFDEAVEIVNKQRCPVCEGNMKFMPPNAKSEKDSLGAACLQCKNVRNIWIKIVAKT